MSSICYIFILSQEFLPRATQVAIEILKFHSQDFIVSLWLE